MATTWKVWNLKWYRVYLGEHVSTQHGKPVPISARIGCVNEQGLVNLWFTSSEPLPATYYGTLPNILHVFLPLNRYPWYMDLLRNEGPHEIQISEDKPILVFLHVNLEEPGEGDQTAWEPTGAL